MAMTEPGISPPASPSDVGRHLRAVRKAKGLSRTEVARSAGLTRRELAAYERGRSPVPDSDLWCLAGSCGVDVGELLPPAARLGIGSDFAALTVGESVARLRPAGGSDGVLREYLAMVYELRNLPPGAKPPMRDEDLSTLAEALGGSPEAIEAKLHELIGASRDEAARLRSLILPPRPISAPVAAPLPPDHVAAPVPVGVGATGGFAPAAPYAPPIAPPIGAPFAPPVPVAPAYPSYPPPTFDFAPPAPSIGDPAATDRFFSAPHAEDPFAPPPPLEPLAPPHPPGTTFGAPAPSAFAAPPSPLDALAPPTVNGSTFAASADPFGPGPTIDPFAPPTGPPLAAAPPAVDHMTAPVAPSEPVRPDGFVADLGTALPDATVAAYDPFAPSATGPVADERFGALPPHLDDPFAGAPDPRSDPVGGVEMVVLDVGPDGTVVDSSLPVDAVDDDPDPFAVLRVPVEGAEPIAPGGPDAWMTGDPASPAESAWPAADWSTVLDAEAPDGRPDAATDVDAFAAAFDLPPGPPGAGDDASDDWFDRAAAATDALIAEAHIPDPLDPDHPSPAPDDPSPAPDEPLPSVGRVTTVDDPAPSPTSSGPEPVLEPIAWSLSPPPSAPTAVVETAETAPTDQFVAAGPDWEVGGIFPATAMADDGTLALRRADVRWALADITASGDFTVRATVNFTSGAGFGLLFRVSTDASERITGYSFDVDPIYSGGGFLVRQWNDSRQHWKPLAHAPVADTARLYGAHVIEVALRHDTLVASIDGETVMDVPRLSRCSIDAGHEPCRGGRLGVQAWSTTEVTVDRLLVAQH